MGDGASDPNMVGDEPLLIANKTNCPVAVATRRSCAIKLLLNQTSCDIIISDDGLQHHALKKDIEIIMIDGERQLGNGWCLPAGPLREPLKKLSKVDFIVFNESDAQHKYAILLKTGTIYNLLDKKLLLTPYNSQGRTIHAVAGIGNPIRFFSMLRKLGFDVKEHSFPDHHAFCNDDFKFCHTNDIVIMTEKDAIKCRSFAKPNYWVLPIQSEISTDFIEDFLTRLQKLSSIHEQPILTP